MTCRSKTYLWIATVWKSAIVLRHKCNGLHYCGSKNPFRCSRTMTRKAWCSISLVYICERNEITHGIVKQRPRPKVSFVPKKQNPAPYILCVIYSEMILHKSSPLKHNIKLLSRRKRCGQRRVFCACKSFCMFHFKCQFFQQSPQICWGDYVCLYVM